MGGNLSGDEDSTGRVTRWHTREDGRVDDEEVVRAPDLGVRVDDRVGRARADHGGPGPMVRARDGARGVIGHCRLIEVRGDESQVGYYGRIKMSAQLTTWFRRLNSVRLGWAHH